MMKLQRLCTILGVFLIVVGSSIFPAGSERPLKRTRLDQETHSVRRLHQAAQNGNLQVIFLLLAQGVYLDARDGSGATMLHTAARSGQMDTISAALLWMIAHRWSDDNVVRLVNQGDKAGNTPLHYAAQQGHLEPAEKLLRHGGDVNAKNNIGATALHLAAHNGHSRIVELLQSLGTNVNEQDESSFTPLHLAALRGHSDVVLTLLQSGADAHAKLANKALEYRFFGMNVREILLSHTSTPLGCAAFGGHIDVMSALFAHDSTVVNDSSARIASHTGRRDALEWLMQRGVSVSSKDKYRRTLLHFAVHSKNMSVIAFLLQCGVDPKAKEKESSMTPLQYASGLKSGNVAEIITLLCNHGADVRAKDRSGYMALHWAIRHGTREAVGALLPHYAEADLAKKTRYGRTPLCLALQLGIEEGAKALIEHGVSINFPDNRGKIPLHYAVDKKMWGCIRLLLQKGADLHATLNGEKPIDRLCGLLGRRLCKSNKEQLELAAEELILRGSPLPVQLASLRAENREKFQSLSEKRFWEIDSVLGNNWRMPAALVDLVVSFEGFARDADIKRWRNY